MKRVLLPILYCRTFCWDDVHKRFRNFDMRCNFLCLLFTAAVCTVSHLQQSVCFVLPVWTILFDAYGPVADMPAELPKWPNLITASEKYGQTRLCRKHNRCNRKRICNRFSCADGIGIVCFLYGNCQIKPFPQCLSFTNGSDRNADRGMLPYCSVLLP